MIIDLNGYSISGEGTGTGTLAKGIYADQRKSVTIRNGTVKGFYFGIFLDDTSSPSFTTSQKHVVEDVRADGNYHTGIYVVGSGNIVRNNKVAGSGGTTVDTGPWAHGIFVAGPGPRVLNNDVNDINAGGIGFGMGIYINHATNGFIQNNRVSDIYSPSGNAYGIYIQNSNSSVVANNVIGNPELNGNSYGIALDTGDDHVVSDNRITKMQYGIYFLGVTNGTYMNNLVRGSTTPYSGGTPAGSTNY